MNIESDYSNLGNLNRGVPHGSVLGPLIFLIYVNDIPQSVDCDLLLYADNTCLDFTDKNIKTTVRANRRIKGGMAKMKTINKIKLQSLENLK